jgi:chemotaxis protein CheX
MTATEARLALPATLSSAAAPELLERLLALRGSPLELQAGEVRKLGGQCAQVLMSAALTWRTDGCALRIVEPSDEFGEALRLLGLSLDSVTAGDRAR